MVITKTITDEEFKKICRLVFSCQERNIELAEYLLDGSEYELSSVFEAGLYGEIDDVLESSGMEDFGMNQVCNCCNMLRDYYCSCDDNDLRVYQQEYTDYVEDSEQVYYGRGDVDFKQYFIDNYVED